MQTHTTGPVLGSRQGSVVSAQTFKAPAATNTRLLVIDASEEQPVGMSIAVAAVAAVQTAVSIGTSSGGTQLSTGGAINAGSAAGQGSWIAISIEAIYFPAFWVFTSRTEIWVNPESEAYVHIQLAEINIADPE